MSVQFEEEQLLARAPVKSVSKGIPSLLVSWGLAKDEKSAATLLLLACGGALVLSIGILVVTSSGKQPVAPEEYQDPARVIVPPPRTL
ncbi:MAG TPA: hypothetical protein VNU25_01835 [Candidatus Paceibacterota bacterium]|nr:hypothetical protein [Candidatus Paceibacterota bacterium]